MGIKWRPLSRIRSMRQFSWDFKNVVDQFVFSKLTKILWQGIDIEDIVTRNWVFAPNSDFWLKYERYTQLGCKHSGIRKFMCMTKTQFPWIYLINQNCPNISYLCQFLRFRPLYEKLVRNTASFVYALRHALNI